MVFTIALAMLVPAGVGLFDVYIATQQRAKLQDALDAATLYAARSNGQTSAAIDAAGDKALAANLQLISGATLLSSSFTLNGSKVDAVAQVRLPAFAPTAFDHQPMEGILDVWAGIRGAEEALEIRLVLGEDKRWDGSVGGRFRAERILAQRLVPRSNRGGPVAQDAWFRGAALMLAAPHPRVPEPKRRQHV